MTSSHHLLFLLIFQVLSEDNNNGDNNHRVQELLTLLHTSYRCHTPKNTLLYLEELPTYAFDPGVEWVPRAVVVRRCSGYCPSSHTHCVPTSLTNSSQPLLKIDRIRNKISYESVKIANHTECGCRA